MYDAHQPATVASVGVGGWAYTALNLPWSTIVSILTAFYIALQCINIAPTVWAKFKNWHAGKGWQE